MRREVNLTFCNQSIQEHNTGKENKISPMSSLLHGTGCSGMEHGDIKGPSGLGPLGSLAWAGVGRGGPRGPIPSFCVILSSQKTKEQSQLMKGSHQPLSMGFSILPCASAFHCIMPLEKLSVLQLPPIFDISDFSCLKLRQFGFSSHQFLSPPSEIMCCYTIYGYRRV